MEKYESRLRSPMHLRMDGKSLNLAVHVVSFFSRADTRVYSENGAFATTSAKLGDVYSSRYRTPKSRTMLQRHSLSPSLSARRGNSARIAPCLSCGIRSRPTPSTSTVIPECNSSRHLPAGAILDDYWNASGRPATGWVWPASRGSKLPIDFNNLYRRHVMARMNKAGLTWYGWHA